VAEPIKAPDNRATPRKPKADLITRWIDTTVPVHSNEGMAPTEFSPEIVDAVLRHMNTDHAADNLVIVRAFADPAADSAVMTGLDGNGGVWAMTSSNGVKTEVRIDWGTPVTKRSGIRHEVVVLYDTAREKLGLEPRTH
jgi:hypothetical protein